MATFCVAINDVSIINEKFTIIICERLLAKEVVDDQPAADVPQHTFFYVNYRELFINYISSG